MSLVLAPAAAVAGCGSGVEEPCAEVVIDWEGGPSPYRSEEEAVAGFLADFPDLARLGEVELSDGRVLASGRNVGSYRLEALSDDTVGVVGARWCYDVPVGN